VKRRPFRATAPDAFDADRPDRAVVAMIKIKELYDKVGLGGGAGRHG
jgi:hypothetical protein